MKIQFLQELPSTPSTLVVGCLADKKLFPSAEALNQQTGNAVFDAMEENQFQGKKGEILVILSPKNLTAKKLVVVGFGAEKDFSLKNLQEIGGSLYTALQNTKGKPAHFVLDGFSTSSFKAQEIAAHLAYGLYLKSWKFTKYYTQDSKKPKNYLSGFDVILKDPGAAHPLFDALKAIAEGVFFTRELVSEPPNVIYPQSMAQRINERLSPLGVKVEILGEEALKKLGMGALLGVGQGSEKESHLVVMQWKGGKEDQKPLAFIGKGVTFDSGGLSLKPCPGMEDMKYDMAGAGAVAGLMYALAARKAKVNAIGVVGLVENMPSGTAIRPSDILTSMSGQTIEVLNTDAEGRLVLSDALWYTQNRFNPQLMVNLATLTGAIVITLGDHYAGLFSNNDALADNLFASGQATGEKLWRLPLDEVYDKEIDSTIADMKNLGSGRKAGSITAAQFLQRFVNKVPWAHLDIAGMAWADKSQPVVEKGASGFGVRLLDTFIKTYYEQ